MCWERRIRLALLLLVMDVFGMREHLAARADAELQHPAPAPSSQKPSSESAPSDPSRKKEGESSDRDLLADPERELLDRAAIEYRKAEHRRALEASEQLLARARQLQEQWRNPRSAQRVEALLREIERLARRVRSLSGASDLEERAPPSEDLERALERLCESAERVHAALKKLTAYVVSVEVMERSDEIIRLARYLRERGRTERRT